MSQELQTPAEAAQEFGRHSPEHTAAQVGRVADQLLDRSVNIYMDPAAEKSSEELPGIVGSAGPTVETTQSGSLSRYNIDYQGRSRRGDEHKEGLVVTEEDGKQHEVERVYRNFTGENKARYDLETRGNQRGIEVNVDPNLSSPDMVDATLWTERGDGGSTGTYVQDIENQRKAAAGTLSKVRDQVAQQRTRNRQNASGAIDNFFKGQ